MLFALHGLLDTDDICQFPCHEAKIRAGKSHRSTHAFKESLGMLAARSDSFDVFRGCPASEH
jgi:hypothetical protein